MGFKRSLFICIGILISLPIYQNCAKKSTSFSEAASTDMLNQHMNDNNSGYDLINDQGDGVGTVPKEDLFDNVTGGDSNTTKDDTVVKDLEKNPDQNMDGSPTTDLNCAVDKKDCIDAPVADPDIPDDVPEDKTVDSKIPVQRWCRGRADKGNVKDSKVITVKITSADGKKVLCQYSHKNLIDEVLKKKSFTVVDCNIAKLADSAKIYIFNDEKLSLFHGDDKQSFNLFPGVSKDKVHSSNTKANAVYSTVAAFKSKGFLPILIKDNYRKSDSKSKTDLKGDDCEKYDGSPLVIDMRAYSLLAKPFYLSAPEEGVEFDILGAANNHAKVKISWLKDARIMPVVLPANGVVSGIDQMFGDHTKGPDGFMADNGFKALAKYDAYSFSSKSVVSSERDGIIDANDEVYSRLRLWNDVNLNAVAEPNELVSLATAGVKGINLAYNPKFHVRDAHGNHIKFKSAVKMSDGKYRPIFDIWFALDETN